MENDLIDLKNPLFTPMLSDLNLSVLHVVKNIYGKKFIAGDITLKLSISTDIDFTEVDDGYGKPVSKPYETPIFDYRINTTLQNKHSIDGQITVDGSTIEEENGILVFRKVDRAQMSVEDFI